MYFCNSLNLFNSTYMNNSIFMFPKPENEPVKGYAPGSAERNVCRRTIFKKSCPSVLVRTSKLFCNVFLVGFFSLVLLCGCGGKENDGIVLKNSFSKASGVSLGNQLTNIYATGYMRALYRQKYNLPPSATTPVYTTHLYVKLHPEDTTQFSMIVDDTVINAFPFPLDYELIGQGNYVQPAEDSGWVYAVVPVDWLPLSKIPHLLIDRGVL